MKVLKTIVVIMVLFVLPGASWYFLQSGLDWRKEKAELLEAKEDLKTLGQLSQDEEQRLGDMLKRRTTLIKTYNEQVTVGDREIADQFKDSPGFQYLVLDTSLVSPVSLDRLRSRANYMLVDTAGAIRRLYMGGGDSVMVEIVQDIALMLPRPIPRDVKMKRAQGYE